MFGSHLSVAGGPHLALLEARRLGMDCLQVFTANQRQWNPKPPDATALGLWHQHRRSTGLAVVVSHDSYLINLAAPDGPNREKSIAALRDELLRCQAMHIGLMVTHPGAHLGDGEEVGLDRVARALDRIHHDLPGLDVVTCLEITAGQGTSLGHRFEQLRAIIQRVRQPERLAVCLDTAHLLAAGYDLTSASAALAVMQECLGVLGPGSVRVWHLNDSQTPRGSRVDRHQHIGMGHVAPEAFAAILRHPAARAVPKILETPKGDRPDGKPWDAVNLALLRRLARAHPRSRSRPSQDPSTID